MTLLANLDEFISLERTFHELATSEESGDNTDLTQLFGREAPLRWSDLLELPRVILLSEAGSGKTEEIRHATRSLRSEGKSAFFLRIEHLVHDFESCFEEGTLEEFQQWITSNEKGWLLLDSVDEARLRDPKDFERAIRNLGVKLRSSLQNVHIVITGRTDAWRPKTDLLLCKTTLTWTPSTKASDEDSAAPDADAVGTVDVSIGDRVRSPFRIVALDDLKGEQLDRFATAKGVTDIKAFRLAVERAEAWSFTTRPLDLAETIEFWVDNNRIGSRLELMRSSIAKRLEERDQDRSEARPITPAKIREGVRLIAAAATLVQESAIRVPDGQQNTKGIAIKEVLTDWDDIDCATLLSRPIFDEGIYGTVRFHHRTVREYLTAEWLHGLIVDDASRAKIEILFFRHQYGIDVIVPTMRPILPWLAILDTKILARVCRVAPEVLFEGGDPSQLPLDTRRVILRQTCEQLAQPAHGRSMTDYSAVQRFTNPDLADEIGTLLDQYTDDDDIVWFLLRMVWQGDIVKLAEKAKHFAISSRKKYARIAAIRAVNGVGSPVDREEVRRAFQKETEPLSRDWLAEFVPDIPHRDADIIWLLDALGRAGPKEQFSVDPLSNALQKLVGELPLDVLPLLLEGFQQLLKREPVIERRHCEISKHYGWLSSIAAHAAIRLVEARQPAALTPVTLSILRLLPIVQRHDHPIPIEIHKDIPKIVQAWPELNYRLFWHCVKEGREQLNRKKDERLIDYWHVSIFGAYWNFGVDAFDKIVEDIQGQSFLDDRLVALTLAFGLYREGGRSKSWREKLKRVAAGTAELNATLDSLLKPPASGQRKWRQQEAAWARRNAREAAREASALEDAKRLLVERINQLRDPGMPRIVTNDQHYLHERIRGAENPHNRWTDGNWQSLIAVYGEPVAQAFRDGAVAYWRHHKAQLRSEGAVANSTSFSVIFGLTGLAIEARETSDWPNALKPADAELATRYGVHELNGFPAWLQQLYATFPMEVANILLEEIRYDLATESEERESHYVLHDVSWHGQWIWNHIATQLLPVLAGKRKNPRNLGYLLTIVQGSSTDDATIARMAARKAKTTRNLTFAPIWFAVWIGVAPEAGIPALAARLAEITDQAEQTTVAVRFIVSLLGGRTQEGRARQAYRTVEHMKTLYLLMHKYIRQKDDIDRAGKGVFSPDIRDDAQDARSALFSFIHETPGKDAFLALLEMARAHPKEESRPWMSFHAKNKAATDADVAAWTPAQLREFNDSLVRTPTNHRELWYLAVDRLEALKYDLEDGDTSIASILQAVDQETEFRKFIGGWCRDRAGGRYNIPQEEELADAKRPDLRFLGAGFDGPVPTELKVADKWTGPRLFERLETQLCGDYLRDVRSTRGIFGLVYLGMGDYWELPGGGRAENFDALIDALRAHWIRISAEFPGVEDIAVIGIDLTRRGMDAKAVKEANKQKKAAKKKVKEQKSQSELIYVCGTILPKL